MPSRDQKSKQGGKETIRLSVTLPTEVHDALTYIAEEKDVSLSWVMRKAAEQYVQNQTPLFADPNHNGQGGETQ